MILNLANHITQLWRQTRLRNPHERNRRSGSILPIRAQRAMADLLATVAAPLAATGAAARHGGSKVVGLTPTQLGDLTEQAIAWAAAHGLLVGWRDPSKAASAATPATFTHIPFCLLPVQVHSKRLLFSLFDSPCDF